MKNPGRKLKKQQVDHMNDTWFNREVMATIDGHTFSGRITGYSEADKECAIKHSDTTTRVSYSNILGVIEHA